MAGAVLLGAVAQRFLAQDVADIEHEEADVLSLIRDISERLQSLERAVRERQHIAEPRPRQTRDP